jgi:hypothetical protein
VSWLLWWRQPPRLTEVVVNLKHEPEIVLRGLLVQARGGWLVLRKASTSDAHGTTPLHGDIYVPRENVSFLQALPPVSP